MAVKLQHHRRLVQDHARDFWHGSLDLSKICKLATRVTCLSAIACAGSTCSFLGWELRDDSVAKCTNEERALNKTPEYALRKVKRYDVSRGLEHEEPEVRKNG